MKNRKIEIRVSEEQLALLKRRAHNSGLTLSAYCLSTLLSGTEKEPPKPKTEGYTFVPLDDEGNEI